ncbi:hypothetical protein HXX76_001180 [Chlamydomonas incerta]|uniref:Uncharacterized protein n=1 Tax=Chlamydomonas incerta TaxID=51695 RepID=A0A836B154_CHLIN|nr:hypothetical protein HXX76_001180 [Chlamydomonas incerta]|eukprot:KAG2444427.1 hypothetical protein HXX76_001180 [Chlamydomonas incerta]
MSFEAYCNNSSKGRRGSKELYLPVLPGAWALGDGLDVQLIEEFRSRGRAQSPPPPRQSGNESPSVWSSLLESLTGALDLSGGWEYSRSEGNRILASRGAGGVSAGGGDAESSIRGASGADGVVVVTGGSRDVGRRGVSARPAGGGLLHRSCSTGIVPSVVSEAPAAVEAPTLRGRINSGSATAAAPRQYGALHSSGPGSSGSSSGTASARTSTCGLLSTAASIGTGSAASTSTGMGTASSSCMTTSTSTPTTGRSARSSASGCAAAAGSGAATTLDFLASLPAASGCADRDLIDSVLASPLGVPAQVSVCKQD